jgi:hypothetical protein
MLSEVRIQSGVQLFGKVNGVTPHFLFHNLLQSGPKRAVDGSSLDPNANSDARTNESRNTR